MRIPTLQLLAEWFKAHVQSLEYWTDPATGQIRDPFESPGHDVGGPAEFGGSATALFIAAGQARRGHPQAAALLQGYCRHTLERLAEKAMPAAEAAFLRYFGLLAVGDLKGVAAQQGSPVTAGEVTALAAALCEYQGRPEEPGYTHVAATQAGIEILRFLHGGAGDWDRCKQQLSAVRQRQGASGFLNDDSTGLSLSVAYHMLSVHLLAAVLSRVSGMEMPPDAQEALAGAAQIVGNGYGWLGRLLANDGMFAQCGSGRYHPFAQAAGAALLAAAGVDVEDACVRRLVSWMDRHRLPANPSAGLAAPVFAVTPNFCPPALRAGFDDFATVTGCNNLAMAVLTDALAWWTGDLPRIAPAAQAHKAFFDGARARGCYVDEPVGLACLRNRGYVLVSLRTDSRRTVPAGSLIHLRLGDDLHEKSVAPPFWADPRVSPDVPSGSVWEGPLLCPAAQDAMKMVGPPAFLMQDRTAACQAAPSSVTLKGSGPDAEWVKTVALGPTGMNITWRVQTGAAGQRLLAVVACVMWDGNLQTQLRFGGAEVLACRCGRTWRMTIFDRGGRLLPGSWVLAPWRSTLSTSGVTGQLRFTVADLVSPGLAVEWGIRIELVPA